MGRRKTAKKDPRALLCALEGGVADYVDRRDRSAQFAVSGQLIALPWRACPPLPAPLLAALLDLLRSPLSSAETDSVLRFSWRAAHHRIRADIIALLLRARAPAADLQPVLMGILGEPWDASVYGIWVSGAQCRLRAEAMQALTHLARRSTRIFSEEDVARIAEMLAMPGWLLAMRAAQLLVALGSKAARARTQLFQHGLRHDRWQVVEACARAVLAIHGVHRSDGQLWARLLGHERWQVRGRVAQVLSRAAASEVNLGPRVLRRLEEARDDPAYLVRKYAQRALAEHPPRPGGPLSER